MAASFNLGKVHVRQISETGLLDGLALESTARLHNHFDRVFTRVLDDAYSGLTIRQQPFAEQYHESEA